MKRLSNNGFTIVESLIALAVSGALFASTVIMVSGQQEKAMFKAAMTDITSKIQSTINEAESGYYPSANSFVCNRGAADKKIHVFLTGTGVAQGENTDCVYLGRAMMFVKPVSASVPQQYLVHTVVGLKKNPDDPLKEALSFNESQAVAIYRDAEYKVTGPASSNTKVERSALQYGLQVKWIRGPSGEKLAGVAFVMNPGQASYADGASNLQSGATSVSIVPIYTDVTNSENGISEENGAKQIAKTLRGGALLDSAKICFTDGSGRSGLVNLGNAGGTSTVEYTIFPNTDCSP